MQLADRFHKWPWEVDALPAPLVLRWLAVLSVESAACADLYGLPDDEGMVRIRND